MMVGWLVEGPPPITNFRPGPFCRAVFVTLSPPIPPERWVIWCPARAIGGGGAGLLSVQSSKGLLHIPTYLAKLCYGKANTRPTAKKNNFYNSFFAEEAVYSKL